MRLAAQVGIGADDVIAEVRPVHKVAAVKDLHAQGRTATMVGDGSDVAIEASDLTLVRVICARPPMRSGYPAPH
jgi:Cu+-exporting ATPase